MGFALPGAIAANLVHPERRILAICGDGGFLMNSQEMETAKRLNSNITVMVWEDGGYGLISWKQENEFDRSTDLAFSNPDWLKLADAFGWSGHLVTRAEQLRSTLEQTFNEPGPSLLVIPIDYNENKLLTKRLEELTTAT
jgi:acetolactate synthase-1/2/3 large subunit